jgi:hypothetical protein
MKFLINTFGKIAPSNKMEQLNSSVRRLTVTEALADTNPVDPSYSMKVSTFCNKMMTFSLGPMNFAKFFEDQQTIALTHLQLKRYAS